MPHDARSQGSRIHEMGPGSGALGNDVKGTSPGHLLTPRFIAEGRTFMLRFIFALFLACAALYVTDSARTASIGQTSRVLTTNSPRTNLTKPLQYDPEI